MTEPVTRLAFRIAQPGTVRWIGLREARRGPVRPVKFAEIGLAGLGGDRRERPGKRAVTLIQAEHLAVIGALLPDGAPGLLPDGRADPAALRRNVAVAGVNLLALRGRTFRLGTALLRGTGLCAPCSRMEEAFGHGGYAAVRGHGGITAEVVEDGQVRLGDAVAPGEDG